MKLILFSDSSDRVLKISLQRSNSSESLIFSDTEALKRFIEEWSNATHLPNPAQEDDQSEL
ncbi:MAG: hypothetical protein ACK424_03890 [Candidatus Thermochlorobacter sp.]